MKHWYLLETTCGLK